MATVRVVGEGECDRKGDSEGDNSSKGPLLAVTSI